MYKLIKIVFLLILLSVTSNLAIAQQTPFSDFPSDVQSKINENKAKGLPLFEGVVFKYELIIDPQFRNHYPSSNDLNVVLSQIKTNLEFNDFSFVYAENKQLIVKFQGQKDLKYDDIKILMTEKKLYLLNITHSTFLKQ
ncbi:MAG: hypothetical protein IT234_01145 [Bacteroidia bacterium]|nr:hypothetical protein [Bacteroidia bacterium]